MSTFNYRVFKENEQIAPNENEEVFTIRQVGYDSFNGKKVNYGKPYCPIGNTSGELLDNITQIILAFNKPVLTKEDF